jgi:hypothetical protein
MTANSRKRPLNLNHFCQFKRLLSGKADIGSVRRSLTLVRHSDRFAEELH